MNIAFLFDSDNPELGGWYGYSVLTRLLDTGVLQTLKQPMRVSVGDILTYMTVAMNKGSIADLHKLNKQLYVSKGVDRIFRDRLNKVISNGTVYSWLFQNITDNVLIEIHNKLEQFSFYLGAMVVDFSYEPHLAFFRNSLIEKYRFSGPKVSEFFSFGGNEDPDIAIKDAFEERGFSVDYEDIGARRSIFDNYDGIGHFRRVAEFCSVFSHIDGLIDQDASSITFSLEELHPQLFDVFAAAARALRSAETEEDFAQAALSGRRLLERLADYLYPSRDGQVGGRKVGKAEYKNRLWAYIEQTMSETGQSDDERKLRLGREADRLVKLFNGGLHADVTQHHVEGAFRDLVIWLADLIELSPAHARKPYLAYQAELEQYANGLQ